MTPRRRIIPIFVPHAGCPNQCVFCNQKRISGSLFPVSEEDVRFALSQADLSPGLEVAFYGGSFTAIPEEKQNALLEAVQPFRENGLVSSIRLSTRPDAIDEGILERLKIFGVRTIELGTQSMCDDVLMESGRGHTSQDTVNASRIIRKAGLSLILQMMTGLPGSSDEKDIYTARRIAELKPDGVRIYPTVIIRDTPLEELWHAGKYAEHTVDDAVRVCAAILPVFEEADIPVIRLGLNPTEELSHGAVAAGAYHPALGELVRSRIWLEKARILLRGVKSGEKVTLCTAERNISAVTGQHRGNIDVLVREFSLSELHIKAADCGENDLFLLK